LAGEGGVVCVHTMSSIDSWLQPLRAYPPALVMVAFLLAAGAVTWVIAKALKWSVYIVVMIVFAGLTAAFALWLWP